ncbi:hypothetical protein [Palleronia abyssalis]|uniref:Uncharacterized protein n=1 Tax=Palleronia abyssalis TaxID=1501240 RepID=A0A2R8BY45_9RHOB|nr:hypothetical protein [Palleronia abyssalis]SPJ25052.1 hypothetical protein PAA8504_02895 [Palleronia abyssalis]
MNQREERGLALCAQYLRNAASGKCRVADFEWVREELDDREDWARCVLICAGYHRDLKGRWVSREAPTNYPPTLKCDYSMLSQLMEDEDPSDRWDEDRAHLHLVS